MSGRTVPREIQAGFAYVNTDTGETLDACPNCAETEVTMAVMQRKLTAAYSQIGKLEGKAETDARRHKLWPEAEAVFTWWAIATNHPGVEFGAEEFNQIRPRLKQAGIIELLKGIAGAAFDPGTKRMANGRLQRYDDIELICRSQAKLRSFTERAPGAEGSEQWKAWLVDRIESSLTPEKP